MTADERDDDERKLVLKSLGAAQALRRTSELLEDRTHAFAEGGISARSFMEFITQHEGRVEDHVGDAILLRWNAARMVQTEKEDRWPFKGRPAYFDVSTPQPQQDAAREDDLHDGNPT